MKESIEFSDMGSEETGNSRTHLTQESRARTGGCHITTITGFILALLAILIAVGVGVIVHFAAPARTFECHCNYPGVGQNTPATPSPEAQWQACFKFAEERNRCIVSDCLTGSPSPNTTIPATTEIETTTEEIHVPPKIPYKRLPRSLLPVHYRVEIEPRMYTESVQNFSFRGSVEILIDCVERTNNVTLHLKGLDLVNSSIDLSGVDGASAPNIVNYNLDNQQSWVIFNLDGDLVSDKRYILKMDFSAPLNSASRLGLYLGQYEEGNRTVYFAVTQFQLVGARKAFPCFDEPGLKAQFDVTLVRRPDMMTLSNMPILRSENRTDGLVADVYNTTVKMSVYTLAFYVGNLTYKEQMTANGVKFRVYARPEVIDQADYALDVGVKMLDYFENYFDIPFPLPKLDMVATEKGGAMENWGLVTYSERIMLHAPLMYGESSKVNTARIVAHELAHMWFGNLVTPSTWNDLWLSEGLVSNLQFLAVMRVHENWKAQDMFLKDEIGLYSAFNADSRPHSIPVYLPIDVRSKLWAVMGTITYAKGGSLVNMMRSFLGEETLLNGLKKYLRKFAYGVVDHNDMWSALSKQSAEDGSNIDVKSVMDTWILQINYPVITFKRSADTVTVSQERFLLGNSSGDPGEYPSPYGYMWEVPVTLTSNLEMNFTNGRIYWLRKDQKSATIQEPSVIPPVSQSNSWVIGNIRQGGFYRVNYDGENWAALINQLKTNHKVIDTVNRAQIIDDAWNLVQAGLLDLLTALRTTEYLVKEEEYVPFDAAQPLFTYLRSVLLRTATFGPLKEYIRKTVAHLYKEKGMNTTDVNARDILFRKLVVTAACRNGDETCVLDAIRIFSDWMQNEDTIPVIPEFAYAVYCTAIEHGGVEEWDFAYRMLQKMPVALIGDLVYALACSRESWLHLRYLQKRFLLHEVTEIERIYSLYALATNPIGPSVILEFLAENWADIKNSTILTWSIRRYIPSVFSSEYQLKQIERLGIEVPPEVLKKVRSNKDWVLKNEEVVADWLQRQE